jgi:hypothetical protein
MSVREEEMIDGKRRKGKRSQNEERKGKEETTKRTEFHHRRQLCHLLLSPTPLVTPQTLPPPISPPFCRINRTLPHKMRCRMFDVAGFDDADTEGVVRI